MSWKKEFDKRIIKKAGAFNKPAKQSEYLTDFWCSESKF